MVTKTEQMLIGALIVTVVTALVVVALISNRPIQNTGTIKAIGFDVFSDRNCTVTLTEIQWGMLSPDSSASVVFYAKNTGNLNVTLSYTTSNWSPASAPNYMVVSWNYTGAVLGPSSIIPIQTGLTVAANITGITSFSYTMTIVATEVLS